MPETTLAVLGFFSKYILGNSTKPIDAEILSELRQLLSSAFLNIKFTNRAFFVPVYNLEVPQNLSKT
ncbi:MAG: hypothetical protein COB50_03780 [Thiotrichales bacterium]|nr:MAG: hypothetical protein COB50_03780 [Thiotrichales bacterium]